MHPDPKLANMPRNYKRKTEQSSFSSESLLSAITDMKDGLSRREAAVKYGIPRTTLLRYSRCDGEVQKCSLGRKAVFSMEEESKLLSYVLDCSKMFHGLSLTRTRELAYTYAINLKKANIPETWRVEKMAGNDWLDGFRKRNSSLSLRSPEPTSLGRASAFNRTTVTEFFDNLETVMKRFNFTADSIYNLDETGNSTVQKVQKVLTQKGVKQLGQITSAERGMTITMVSCVSASGQSLPPAYIFPRVHFKDTMLVGAPVGSKGFANPSGWMSNDLFPDVLKHFISHFAGPTEKQKLLILDNHSSHLSIEVVQLARDNNLTVLTFPPHCSHKLQPLDVSVFGPFKKFYNTFVDSWMLANPGKTFSMYHVAGCSGKAYLKAMTPSNIINGFMATGISPFNREIFNDQDFMSCYVTDRQDPERALSNTAADILPPLPKAPPRKANSTKRKRVKTTILTATPQKPDDVSTRPVDEVDNNQPSTSGLVVTRKSRAKRRLDPLSDDESEDSAATPVSSDSEEPDEELDDDVSVGRFALIAFPQKRTTIFYVGELMEVTGAEMKVDFYRHVNGRFTKPEMQDCKYVDREQLTMILPPPIRNGNTNRQLGGITFPFQFTTYNVR